MAFRDFMEPLLASHHGEAPRDPPVRTARYLHKEIM